MDAIRKSPDGDATAVSGKEHLAPEEVLEKLGSLSADDNRRLLEDLRAAINHHADEGYHRGLVKVTLPEKGRPRNAWFTREEAARLIHVCRPYREVQTASRGPRKGQPIETGKRTLAHLARFILIGLHTGSHAGAIAAASPVPAIGRAFVDLERGRYYRLKQGDTETNQPDCWRICAAGIALIPTPSILSSLTGGLCHQ